MLPTCTSTVRTVEVLLREKMHRALTAEYGRRWYRRGVVQLDDRSRREIDKALKGVGPKAPPGKVVAELMLGVWTHLLDAGGPLDRTLDGPVADYGATLWDPALKTAFQGSASLLVRADAHALAMTMHWARNRINHCEPVVFGFPQPGQGGPGQKVRKTPARVLADARHLAEALDPAVAAWMAQWTAVDALVAEPLADAALTSLPANVFLVS